jgi:TorA maturation chaperone TorD
MDVWSQLAALRTDEVLSGGAALLREIEQPVPDGFAPGERPATDLDPSGVLARLPNSAEEMCAAYENTFGLLVSCACPPYEMEYIDSKFVFQRSHLLADLAGYYRAFGLEISGKRPERSDHVANQLEFMAIVVGLERRAAADESDEQRQRIEVCQQAQTSFFRDHLAWWIPAFARLLERENPNGFYGAAGRFLAAFVPGERAVLGVAAPRSVAAPSTIERPEACDGCEIA